MTDGIETLIEQRPHLRDPLEFYAKWQRFQREVKELLPKAGADLSPQDSKAYPPGNAGAVFQLFSSIFELPRDEFEPLNKAFEDGDIDFMRLPLEEIPPLSLPYSEDEQAAILFLLSRPYFQALRSTFPLDGRQWDEGRCPLCSAKPALTSITEGPKRLLHCSWCGTVGPYRFIGCPNCGTAETSNLRTLESEEEPGYRVSACDGCRSYVKIIDGSILKEMAADLTDITSLPLDIVAQNKGYARCAPNPIGLKKME